MSTPQATNTSGVPLRKRMPYVALGTAACLFLTAVGLSLAGKDTTTLVPYLASAIPGLLAAGFAEKNQRDLHNGVITTKSKEGAKQALNELGVVTRNEPLVEQSLQALTDILAALHPEAVAKIDASPDVPDPHLNGNTQEGTTT